MHLRPFSATFYCACGVNWDTTFRFPDSDFLTECEISAIWLRFPLIFFAFDMLKLRHISNSSSFHPLTYKVGYTTRFASHGDNFHQVWSWYDHLLPSYSVLLLIRYVTLWPWPLTFWPWTVVIHGGSRDQPRHQLWRPLIAPVRSWDDVQRLPLITIKNAHAATAHAPNHVTRE